MIYRYSSDYAKGYTPLEKSEQITEDKIISKSDFGIKVKKGSIDEPDEKVFNANKSTEIFGSSFGYEFSNLGTNPFMKPNPFSDVINFSRRKKNDQIITDIIAVPAKDVFTFQQEIMKKISSLVKKGHKVQMIIDGCASTEEYYNGRIPYTFNFVYMFALNDLNRDLKKIGLSGSIKFNEFFETTQNTDLDTCWDFEDVVKANNEIDRVVQKIENLHLTPYEAMVYIHKYLTQTYGYEKHVDETNLNPEKYREIEKNHSIVSAILSKKTICVGFASMTKAIIDELNMPGLKCELKLANCWEREGQDDYSLIGIHSLAKIEIEDPKYNVSGTYLDDATWDCKNRDNPNGKGYAYFMYSIKEMSKLIDPLSFNKGSIIKVRGKNFRTPNEQQKINEYVKSDPIPYNVFEKAVKKVYSLESDFCQQNNPDETAQKDILRSMERAQISRTDDENPLVKKYNEILKNPVQYLDSEKIR